MNTKINNKPKAGIIDGVNKIVDAVKVTLGPFGQNVIIEKEWDEPHVTKDGATVAKAVNLKDPLENCAAQLVKSAALKTCESVGDGTTTTSILIQAFVNNLKGFDNMIEAQRAYERMTGQVVKALKVNSKKAKLRDIEKIAYISANNDSKIAEVVALAYGGNKYRLITAEASETSDTEVEIVNGMRIKNGLFSRYYANQADGSCVLNKPIIAIFKDKINKIQGITQLLDSAIKFGNDVLLIAPDFSNEVTNILVNNKQKGKLNICCVKSPGFGATREPLVGDLFAIVGNNYYYDAVMSARIEDLGQARKVVVTDNNCDIIEGFGDSRERLEEVKKLKVNNVNRELINSRLANLSGGVAVIKVGSNSEAEAKEKLDRFDDAIGAVRTALNSGIVVGGGAALVHAIEIADLEESKYLTSYVQACCEPFKQILRNAGMPEDTINKLLSTLSYEDPTNGYNISKFEITNFFTAGIVDPLDVTINALRNATSTACVLMTSSVALTLDASTDK